MTTVYIFCRCGKSIGSAKLSDLTSEAYDGKDPNVTAGQCSACWRQAYAQGEESAKRTAIENIFKDDET